MIELFLIFLVVTALIAIEMKDLLNSAIVLAAFSLVLTFLFFSLHALDIAIAEAAVGAGVSTVLFVVAISKTRRHEE
ncbi:MAG: hydrogenase subunit MbhD domain-containing protein [Candidatus Margulisiibacteriota bacterium]|nr:hydrogenase subunit MbhD domain-containing protein [Candidatus Margulisiibacteriota bacterium]